MNDKTDKQVTFKNVAGVDEAKQELEEVKKRDPIHLFESELKKRKILTDAEIEALDKEQKEIEIYTIEFTYGENSIAITKSNFDKFLRVNQFIDYRKDNFTIKTMRVDGRHNPSIFAKKTLISFLNKEVM